MSNPRHLLGRLLEGIQTHPELTGPTVVPLAMMIGQLSTTGADGRPRLAVDQLTDEDAAKLELLALDVAIDNEIT